jgi:DNA primase
MSAVVETLTPLVGSFRKSGTDWVTRSCPFHSDRTPSFAVNTRNGCWVCHSCGQKGTLPRLLKLLGLPREQVDRIMTPLREQLEEYVRRQQFALDHRFERDPFRADYPLPEHLLGLYDFCPTLLLEKGFDPAVLQSLDIGFDRGRNRITFPIRDLYGNLAGLSGRTTVGAYPRYKVYTAGFEASTGWVNSDFGANFDEEYPDYTIDKSRFLWNGHEALPIAMDSPSEEPVIVVEGYKACLWLIQAGFPLTVALMGASLSTFQADLLRRLANPIVLFLDNNSAGHAGTRRAVDSLSRSNTVKSVTYPDWAISSTQPDDFETDVLNHLILNAKPEYWKGN